MIALAGVAASLVGFGLLYAFSPSTYALVLHILTTSQRALRTIAWLCLGMALAALGCLLLFRVVDPETLTALAKTRAEEVLVRRGVDLAAGAVLLLAGIIAAMRARGPRPAPKPRRAVRRGEPAGHMILLGAAEALTSVSGMATMYVAGRVIASASRDLLVQALLVAVLLAAVMAQHLLVAWLWGRFPALARRVTALYDRLVAIDRRPLLAAGLLVAGAVFLVLGILPHDAPHLG